jgi:uncharacterized protein
MPPTVEPHPESTPELPQSRLRIKAVPGAKRPGLAGLLGDRLKVKVNAPAEDGKANRAICDLIAGEFSVNPGQVTVESGQNNPEKTLRITGIEASVLLAAIDSRLGTS